ncbi:MAG: hypothetical protein R3E95_11830 [Thiolinea sp.]
MRGLERLQQKFQESGETGTLDDEAASLVFAEILRPHKTQLQQTLLLTNEGGEGRLALNLDYVGLKDNDLSATHLADLQPQDWLEMLRGSVTFILDQAVLPVAAVCWKGQPFISKDNDRYTLDLQLEGDQYVLNGETLSFDAVDCSVHERCHGWRAGTLGNNLPDEDGGDEDTINDEGQPLPTPEPELQSGIMNDFRATHG